MHYSLRICFFTATLFAGTAAIAQTTPFSTKEYIDINNIRAAQLVHGDMWWDPATLNAQCEFPKGSGKHVGFNAGIWMAGYDNQAQLKVAAQMYRSDGNDYWPGPLAWGAGAITYAESEKWAKVWKLNRNSLDSFLNEPNHTVANTPSAILTWPAKGNVYAAGNNNAPLTITENLAPFHDRNNNQIYEPLLGEYPVMKGDQMLWYVFNDDGPAHDQTNSQPLHVETHFTAYAYKQNSLIDNVIFYEYKVINKSNGDLDSFCLGIRADVDLGYAFDDYIAFDSTHSLGIAYNGDALDGAGEPSSYGDSIPIVGIKVLQQPLDTCGSVTPAGSFMYFNNGNDPASGHPNTPVQYNNFLRSTFRNGQPLRNDYQGPGLQSNGLGAGPIAKYAFNGDPTNSAEWSECSSQNPAADRRFIIASQPLKLTPGMNVKFATALIVTPRKLGNACPGADFTDIRNMSDSAQKIFCNPLIYTSVKDANPYGGALKLYPNPASSTLYLQTPVSADEQVTIFDGIGRRLNIVSGRKGDRLEIDIANLANGMYYIQYRSGDKVLSRSFLKN